MIIGDIAVGSVAVGRIMYDFGRAVASGEVPWIWELFQ